jgi:Tfp pilus assembly protein PilF
MAEASDDILEDINYHKLAITYCNRGLNKYRSRDLRGAINDYELAIAADPKFAEAYHSLGLFTTTDLQRLIIIAEMLNSS